MKHLKSIDTSRAGEKALLVEMILKADKPARKPLEELIALARTAGLNVADAVVQRRQRPDSAYCIGQGKADELAGLVKEMAIDVVVFDNDLAPAQVRNLEQLLDTKVIDRSELILDIFAIHARTEQAKAQVELAQLEYSLPRLRRMWTHLSRIEGGIGLRGPGEKQLEVDRRIAHKRISELKRIINANEARRAREVYSRRGEFNVSLVGYTNAGKSTLMNALTGAGMLVEDKLFATLDTKTCSFKLPGGGKALLSDTVGFIKNLPHHLVTSFHATLEEALQADLLLHVADAAHPDVLMQIETVENVLDEIGCTAPRILALNKIDLVEERIEVQALLHEFPDSTAIAARTGEGVNDLTAVVERFQDRGLVPVEIRVPGDSAEAGRVRALVKRSGKVLEESLDDGFIMMRARLKREDLGRIEKISDVKIRRF